MRTVRCVWLCVNLNLESSGHAWETGLDLYMACPPLYNSAQNHSGQHDWPKPTKSNEYYVITAASWDTWRGRKMKKCWGVSRMGCPASLNQRITEIPWECVWHLPLDKVPYSVYDLINSLWCLPKYWQMHKVLTLFIYGSTVLCACYTWMTYCLLWRHNIQGFVYTS